jgi:Pyruvate/2-oxoacid:ferredoxin oxidoreductase gamma subunit
VVSAALRTPALARYDGEALYTAPEAVLKGVLESEVPVALVAGPAREPFDGVFRCGASEAAAEILRGHEIGLQPAPAAARGVALAIHTARSGRGAVALVPNEELALATDAITRAAGETLPRGGALVLLLEDRPCGSPATCPRRLARAIDVPVLEPEDLADMRDGLDAALRLSRAVGMPLALVVHFSVLRGADTIESRPNRMIESVDAMLARRRRRRRPRLTESGDVLRLVRRLELNPASSLPSPGERTPVGFVTVGPAAAALRHIAHALRLAGRLPTLHLGVVHPVDDAAAARLLGRCDDVVVLEPRPGTVEASILEVAEAMRQRGERPGAVWGRLLPPDPMETTLRMEDDQALHPSLLARRIVHLLHVIRPAGHAGLSMTPDPPKLDDPVPARGALLGAAAAAARVRRIVADVDQWLHDHRDDAETSGLPPTALAVDGVVPVPAPERVVRVETWDPVRFQREGIAAVRQAARDDAPWIFVVVTVGSEDDQDLERLVRGVIPAERADRVRMEEADLFDPARLAERLRESVFADQLTVIIVSDGPPATYDAAALERSRAEIDRLGFEPRQRMVWPVDHACAVRERASDERDEPRAAPDRPSLRSSFRIDRLAPGQRGQVHLRIRPMLEQATVVRTRPPAGRWRREGASGLPLPEPVHRQASRWRAHVAGFRGDAPGVAARVLLAAGRLMGYAVRSEHDPTPIGAGRRAWTQVLFTRPRSGEGTPRLAVRAPFGDVDLLVGLDAIETLRALVSDPALRVAAPERTYVVINAGVFGDEPDLEPARALRAALPATVREVSHVQPRLVDDFAGACRAWFHTDRVTDVALLGAAFQLGLVPVTVDAIESAVTDVENDGFGRALAAFRFGRQLGSDPRLFTRPREERSDDVGRIVRRMVHLMARRRWRGRLDAMQFGHCLEESLERMPGLGETDLGRQARRDFVIALYRCHQWGGVDHATRYARLVTDLYRVDRGESGRALTRNAILPLAGAMLVRDPIFVASMAASAEQRRRTRLALNVKRAREDVLERRYLTRFDLNAFGRRFRADVRSSDWTVHVTGALRHVVPDGWRGSRRERDLRAYLVELVERATEDGGADYERYQVAFARLHEQALDNRLRGMALSEVKMLVEGGAETRRPETAGAGPA